MLSVMNRFVEDQTKVAVVGAGLLGQEISERIAACNFNFVDVLALMDEDKSFRTRPLTGYDILLLVCSSSDKTGLITETKIAEMANETGIMTIAFLVDEVAAAKPLASDDCKQELKSFKVCVDSFFVIDDSYKKGAMAERYEDITDYSYHVVFSIIEIANSREIISIDREDLYAMFKNKGEVSVYMGHGRGLEKASQAIKTAIYDVNESVLRNISHYLIQIYGDISLLDASVACECLKKVAGEGISIVFSVSYHEEAKDECNVTVIAA